MATIPPPKLSLQAQNRVARDGHCPYLAESLEARLHRPPVRTFEEVQQIIRDRGWD